MGYVPVEFSVAGTALTGEVRSRPLPVTVADLPFITTRYKR
jgi:aminomethyltransferase